MCWDHTVSCSPTWTLGLRASLRLSRALSTDRGPAPGPSYTNTFGMESLRGVSSWKFGSRCRGGSTRECQSQTHSSVSTPTPLTLFFSNVASKSWAFGFQRYNGGMQKAMRPQSGRSRALGENPQCFELASCHSALVTSATTIPGPMTPCKDLASVTWTGASTGLFAYTAQLISILRGRHKGLIAGAAVRR